jgi:uncharacterized protein DUF6298/collagenase-like protein with putative collagen-binding domain
MAGNSSVVNYDDHSMGVEFAGEERKESMMGKIQSSGFSVILLICVLGIYGLGATGSIARSVPDAPAPGRGLRIEYGWFVHDQRLIWGYAQHNGWWGGYRKNSSWIHQYKVRTALCRNAPGQVGPGFTEDLDRLTGAMVRYGYPGFEHNYGLWYDRRRDNHDTQKRTDGKAAAPFLEQPWARSGIGTAWDGLSKYDLTKFNAWYFGRLQEFAGLCETKGTILFHNFYMQHSLLETEAHYVDFPWRPTNCIQKTALPDTLPAANAFYDVSHPLRRKLHRTYIRKCLDELGEYANVIHLTSEEYTGSQAFVEFWIDTILAWEQEKGKQVKIGLAATKDVMDAILADPVRGPRICTVCLSGWWYKVNGDLYAPPGGKEIPGRYTGKLAEQTTPESLYRQVREYRRQYPEKAIILHHKGDVDKMWSFLMAGGSMLIGRMQYPDSSPPKQPWEQPDSYIAPAESVLIQPTYDFIRTHLSDALVRMKPVELVKSKTGPSWCLAEAGQNYLIFALKSGRVELDLTGTPGVSYAARWFDPRSGTLEPAQPGVVKGGKTITFKSPDQQSRVLWVRRKKSESLFTDLKFQRGFLLKYPSTSYGRKTEAVLNFGAAKNKPVWHLGQWGTKYSLAQAKFQKQPNGDRVYENRGKRVLVGGSTSENRDLILEVRGKAEYGNRARQQGESWPHLLVEQDAINIYPLSHLKELDFQVLLKLVHFEDQMNKNNFDPGLHAAQFQMFFIVRNIDAKSKDHHNYFWFGVPFFDSRHAIPKGHQAQDAGKDDATGKFIYSIDGREVNALPLKTKKWVTFQKDLLPYIKAGLQEAGQRGYCNDTDPAHYAVVNMNLGWEIPGTYDAAVQVRELQIHAIMK